MTLVDLVEVCTLSEVPDGEGIKITIEGLPALAVYRVGEEVFVSDDLCTHGDASLSEGELDIEDYVIECPFHQGGFDIRTGSVAGAPCTRPIRVYEAWIKNGLVYIKKQDL
ncbi:MAG: (2Fe-2S)-binding protein [Alphaproteobacteria bacterium]|nr:MAG: (2Fe-2S)-binding protein [Alphaproteobacteria bacterium]